MELPGCFIFQVTWHGIHGRGGPHRNTYQQPLADGVGDDLLSRMKEARNVSVHGTAGVCLLRAHKMLTRNGITTLKQLVCADWKSVTAKNYGQNSHIVLCDFVRREYGIELPEDSNLSWRIKH